MKKLKLNKKEKNKQVWNQSLFLKRSIKLINLELNQIGLAGRRNGRGNMILQIVYGFKVIIMNNFIPINLSA